MLLLIKALLRWIPFALVSTGLCGLVYVSVQQNYRQSLNDPQIQMAEDAALALAGGAQVRQIVPLQQVDLGRSLAPWLAVYSNAGDALLSSGTLNGAPPHLPDSIFSEKSWITSKSYASSAGAEVRFTWQPEPGVRHAVVLVHVVTAAGSRFVAAGRNMSEVENREGQLTLFVAGVWFLLMLGTLLWLVLALSIEERYL